MTTYSLERRGALWVIVELKPGQKRGNIIFRSTQRLSAVDRRDELTKAQRTAMAREMAS